MKLTVWQQFSSNHSDSFFVIGQFESEEWAAEVTVEVRAIVHLLHNWWQQLPEGTEQPLDESQIQPLMRPERQLQEQYGLAAWGVLDWTKYARALEIVHQIGPLVTVNQQAIGPDTWSGPYPFDEILRKLGAQVATDHEMGVSTFAISLEGKAADEAAAQAFLDSVRYEEWGPGKGWQMMIIPGFMPIKGSIARDKTRIFIKDYRLWASRYWRIPLSQVPLELQPYIEQIETEKGITYAAFQRTFQDEFQRLLAYLTKQGFTDIQYQVSQVPY